MTSVDLVGPVWQHCHDGQQLTRCRINSASADTDHGGES
jgi:hypothetical protein